MSFPQCNIVSSRHRATQKKKSRVLGSQMSIHFVARTRNVDCRRKLHEWGPFLAVMHVSRGLMKQFLSTSRVHPERRRNIGPIPLVFPHFSLYEGRLALRWCPISIQIHHSPIPSIAICNSMCAPPRRVCIALIDPSLQYCIVSSRSVGSAYRQRYFDPGCGPRSMLVPVIRQKLVWHCQTRCMFR